MKSLKYSQILCLILMFLTSSSAKHHKQTTKRSTTTAAPPASAPTQPPPSYDQSFGSNPYQQGGYNQQPQPAVVYHVVHQQPSSGSSGGLGTVGGLALGGLAGMYFNHFILKNFLDLIMKCFLILFNPISKL